MRVECKRGRSINCQSARRTETFQARLQQQLSRCWSGLTKCDLKHYCGWHKKSHVPSCTRPHHRTNDVATANTCYISSRTIVRVHQRYAHRLKVLELAREFTPREISSPSPNKPRYNQQQLSQPSTPKRQLTTQVTTTDNPQIMFHFGWWYDIVRDSWLEGMLPTIILLQGDLRFFYPVEL